MVWLLLLCIWFKVLYYTGESIWKGPIGGIMRALCFKKDTPLRLANGKKVLMKDISLGDVLENGSKVCGKLQLQGDPFKSIL